MIIKNVNILENKIYPNKIKFISFYFSYHAHIPLTFVSYSCKKRRRKFSLPTFPSFSIFTPIFSFLFFQHCSLLFLSMKITSSIFLQFVQQISQFLQKKNHPMIKLHILSYLLTFPSIM